MAAKIRKQPESLRQEIAPKVQENTRSDLIEVCKNAEVETAKKAIEFVEKIGAKEPWTLDDWVALSDLADKGRFFMEVRTAFGETK